MRIAILLCLLSLANSYSRAQITADPGSIPLSGALTGPYGIPTMVIDEGGDWEVPLFISGTQRYRYYVPDIASAGWTQWHIEVYQSTGKYFTLLYIYDGNTRQVNQYWLSVDTRNKTATLSHPLGGLLRRINLATATDPLAHAIKKTNAIVADDCAHFHGMTLSQALDEQKKAVVKMIPHN